MNQFEQPTIDPNKIRPYIFIGIAGLFIIILLSNIFVLLGATERGVVFKKVFDKGIDKDNIKGAGYNIIAPWDELIVFEVSENQIEETMDVLSKDGLSISLDVSLRFRPDPTQLGYLYESFQKNYVERLIRPELRSAVRAVVGQYTPEELYASKRQEIETQIEENTQEVLTNNYIILEAMLFRSVKLPQTIKTSIEQKLAAEQEAQKYDFLIEKEKKEAERRKIDAERKATANRILSASITQNILKEKGTSATEELAKSPNSKIIVIGGGDDGLPIILNSDK